MVDIFYEEYALRTSLVSAIIYIIIALFTTIGNVIVLLAFHFDPYKKLRSPQNIFIINLAVSDIIMGAVVDPLLAIRHWDKDENLFLAHYLMAVVSGVSSILNITFLSICRYLAITKPFKYKSIITEKRVLICIAVMWLYVAHFPLLALAGWLNFTYQIYLYTLGAVIPTCVICLTYAGIFRGMRRHTQNMRAVGGNAMNKRANSVLANAMARERSATKTLIIVLVVFLAFWFPFLLLDTVLVNCKGCRTPEMNTVRDITLTMTYFASGINPLLYAWKMPYFARTVKRILCRKTGVNTEVTMIEVSCAPPINSRTFSDILRQEQKLEQNPEQKPEQEPKQEAEQKSEQELEQNLKGEPEQEPEQKPEKNPELRPEQKPEEEEPP